MNCKSRTCWDAIRFVIQIIIPIYSCIYFFRRLHSKYFARFSSKDCENAFFDHYFCQTRLDCGFFFIFKPRCELHAYVLLHRNFQTPDVDFYFTQRLTRTNKIVKSYQIQQLSILFHLLNIDFSSCLKFFIKHPEIYQILLDYIICYFLGKVLVHFNEVCCVTDYHLIFKCLVILALLIVKHSQKTYILILHRNSKHIKYKWIECTQFIFVSHSSTTTNDFFFGNSH